MIIYKMTERSKEFPRRCTASQFSLLLRTVRVAVLFLFIMTYYIKQKTDDCLVYEPKDEEPQDRENYVSDGRNLWELESTTRSDGNILEK